MVPKINDASLLQGINRGDLVSSVSKPPASGFSEMVSKGIQSVNNDLVQASKVSESFMTGEKKYDIHEVMIALEKADISFRYMAQVRNKVLDAYNEVMRMQV